jgi:hypothetical protein
MTVFAERAKSIFRKTERELPRLAANQHPEAVRGFRTTTGWLEMLLVQPAPDGSPKKEATEEGSTAQVGGKSG